MRMFNGSPEYQSEAGTRPARRVSAGRLLKVLLPLLVALTAVMSGAVVRALDAFPQSQLQDEKKQQVAGYRLVLSELKRTQATTYGEQERLLNGQLWRRVWSVAERFPWAVVARHFADQTNGADVLYQCEGLDCGSNNFWANEIFDNARLVGRDQNQFYQVSMSTAADGTKTLYVLYVVQRGTRQVMINLDEFTTKDQVKAVEVTETQIREALKSSAGWLPGFETDDGRLDIQRSSALIGELKSLTPSLKRRLYLLVHCYEASHMTDNVQCSERLAEQLRVASFDGQYELNIIGQGALTPAPDDSLKPALRFIFWPGR
ncbi:MAG: hypothetical protein CMI08_16730 [Oceanospirillaceae bacterium]|uniref:DUF4892 domain-containing protein n=1 Tax=unclassified Thalassolituus TaxID=2624967 RepID=UPI000C0A70F5|nr:MULTISPECIES: DUF4892 domain-containing protein [unclassified Thalassolituus]MAK92065.1 hypothetical protein [Thalassolituus sp.]MAY00813.1 hypothetical protein [Oceanospirillaceae bacterium]MBL34864.1 hypothetical protein [Oceanospirillaceae bacterium]MBS51646.1 hypothetical protein [Oceanospirillaceae bacterium]|tara:strand:+ start:44 stop:997 length:954 start_codon:yes stop_codon:yes gene_type:complete